MAHGTVNEIYRKLGKKIDGTTTRAPWNQALYEIIKALYTPREAELLVRMPYGIARSKDLKLVLSADNVQKNVGFICQCCSCCCNLLLGVSKHGYTNSIVTSTFIAHVDEEKCTGCEKCTHACPINAISIKKSLNAQDGEPGSPEVDESISIGCGVCALACPAESVRLVKREQRVLHPETIFERLILACLERGTLQNQLFNDPLSISHKFMRGFIGGFLRIPPVKQALMSDLLRSRFLSAMKAGAQKKSNKQVLQKTKEN